MKLNILFLGRCEYKKALEIQYDLLKKRQAGEISDTLILVEHPPVLTMGITAKESNVIVSEKHLKERGIDVFYTNRGGDVTYHGDGQIVGYPIVNLKEKQIGVRMFMRNLEEIFIKLLKDKYNIDAGRDQKHTGVWVDDDKIVAMGIAVKRGVTMHGFAFNVNTNLEHFKLIVPCGILNKGVTSVKQLFGKTIDFNKEMRTVLDYFCKVFDYDSFEEN